VFLGREAYGDKALVVVVVLVVAAEAWGFWLIAQITRRHNANRDPYISLSLLALLVVPVIVFAMRWNPELAVLLAGAYFLPFLGMDPTLRSLRVMLAERRIPEIRYPDQDPGSAG